MSNAIYDIGDQVTFTVEFRNPAGVLTNPTTVTAKVLRPDGTESPITPSSSSTGVWSVTTARLDQSGPWVLRMNGTGAVTAATEERFQVRPSSFPSPLT